MSYNYHSNPFPDPVFTSIPTHPSYATAPVSNLQNHGLPAVAPPQSSSEAQSQALNHYVFPSDSPTSQHQAQYAQSPSLDNNTQWWNPSSAVPHSSSSASGLYVNSQATLAQQQEQQQRYSMQNLEYHSHPKQHSQHTLPTPSSSALDNTHPDSSCQTFLPPPPAPATSAQDARSSVPATGTRAHGSFANDKYQPPAFIPSYDQRYKLSEKVLNRGGQANMSQSDQQLGQAHPVPTYDYSTNYDPRERQWPVQQSSFRRGSSSLAHALEPVPSNTPAQQDQFPIKLEEAITNQSHNVQSTPSSTSSQSQSCQISTQATIYPFSSPPGRSKTDLCHVAALRTRPTQPPMPSSSTVIQIPKLPSSPIKQLSTSSPSKLSASPPSSQWSSPGPVDSKDELRRCGKNVAVIIPPSTMQRMPMKDGAPIASMLTDAVANAHFPMPSLEQAVLPKSTTSTLYPIHLNGSLMSLPGSNFGTVAMQQQIAAAARKRGMTVPQHGGAIAQHYSPYMAAKEQRDGRKIDAARLAEMHAANVASAGMARGGPSTSTVSSSAVRTSSLISSTALYPPPVLVTQRQMPQTIAIGSGSGGAGPVEESPSSLNADDGYGREGKLGKKPFLACEFCRHRKIACGKGPTLPPDIILPPGPRTCNQCFRRGLECQFPEASRRGLRHGKPSRRVIYGENNEYRIVDPEDDEFDDDEDDYLEEEEVIVPKGKGKGKAKVPARPWSPIRFVPAVDTAILKELSRKGVIERGGYV